MLLFAISADLAYPIFTNSNEKVVSVFIEVFTKSDRTGPHFYKSSYRLENCHATACMTAATAVAVLAITILSVCLSHG